MGAGGKGNHRFRLSAMMPNAWFYKLRDITTTTKTRSSHHPAPHQYSTRPDNPPTPRRSSSKKRLRRRRTIYMPSPSTQFFNHDDDEDDDDDVITSGPSGFDYPVPGDLSSSSSSSSSSLLSPAGDIIIDVDQFSYTSIKSQFDIVQSDSHHDHHHPQLPPILTRPIPKHTSPNIRGVQTRRRTSPSKPTARKSISSRSGGVRIRGNRPKLAAKKTESRANGARKETTMLNSGSFAIVKASFDPERDFRESMVEMIVENNIRASNDLEDLLACYLSLNANKYHGLIIRAFEQIWFHMPHPLF